MELTTLFDRKDPRPGELWQHWKHNTESFHQYRVFIITQTPPVIVQAGTHKFALQAECTETGQLLDILYDPAIPSKYWLQTADGEVCNTRYVLYRNLEKLTYIWARPYDIFMAKDSRSRTQYKFWRIGAWDLEQSRRY